MKTRRLKFIATSIAGGLAASTRLTSCISPTRVTDNKNLAAISVAENRSIKDAVRSPYKGRV